MKVIRACFDFYIKIFVNSMEEKLWNGLTVFFTATNLGFALITTENINIVTGFVGLVFLVLRNIPFVVVRAWEIYLFARYKRHRRFMIRFWRGTAKKQLEGQAQEPSKDANQDNDQKSSTDGK